MFFFDQGSKLSPDIEETVQGILEGIEDLLASLEESASEYGIVSPMMDEITKAMKTVCDDVILMKHFFVNVVTGNTIRWCFS